LDFYDRLEAVPFTGLTTEDIDPEMDCSRVRFTTPDEVRNTISLAWDHQRVIDLAQGLIINALPKVFLPDGPLWVDIRVHRGGETEEEDEDQTRPIIGVWVEDERVLSAKGDNGSAMLFFDRRGIEHALEEMIDWLEAVPSGKPLTSFTIEEAGKRIEHARKCGHAVYQVGMSLPTDDTTVAIIRGDNMELLVGNAHDDSIIMLEMPAFPRFLLNNLERELLLGDKACEVYA